MAKWTVTYVDDMADRRAAEEARRHHAHRDGRAKFPLELGGPGETLVFADEMRVNGGALVFYRDGEVSEVIGPTVYASARPGE